jgi:hypothetical protein
MSRRRRKRSHLSWNDCLPVLEKFAGRVHRMEESSDVDRWGGGLPAEPALNVIFLVKGGFGVATDLYEAIRVLAGHRLPAKGDLLSTLRSSRRKDPVRVTKPRKKK